MRGGLPPRSGPRGVVGVRGRGLPEVLHVVEDLLVAAARLVLHVVQGADPALGRHLDLLVQNLEKGRERPRTGHRVRLRRTR